MTEEQLYAHLLVCSSEVTLINSVGAIGLDWEKRTVGLEGLNAKGSWWWSWVEISRHIDGTDRQEVLEAVAQAIVRDKPYLVPVITDGEGMVNVSVYPCAPIMEGSND